MLNARALSELLTKNSDERLCKRWFIMTPNGTLIAYTQPADIRDLRRQAAIVTITWQEHQRGSKPADQPETNEEGPGKIAMPGLIRTLTMETDSANLIIRKLQPQLLLVLEGGVPPRKRAFEAQVTPEGPGDIPYPKQEDQNQDSARNSAASSLADSSKSAASCTVLGMQRRKLDALASAIAKEFERTGFKMPEEGENKFF